MVYKNQESNIKATKIITKQRFMFRRRLLMKKRYAETRMHMVLTEEDNERIRYEEDEDGLTVTVDVHGLSARRAQRLINNIIAVIQYAFTLLVIHGYVHGTKILEMIRNRFENTRTVSIKRYQVNNGETEIVIAA